MLSEAPRIFLIEKLLTEGQCEHLVTSAQRKGLHPHVNLKAKGTVLHPSDSEILKLIYMQIAEVCAQQLISLQLIVSGRSCW